MQFGQQNQGRIAELEREILALRGEYERNQIMLERYDNVSFSHNSMVVILMIFIEFRE